MTGPCAPPPANLGVSLRLAGYLDCQARSLGENGFRALTAGPEVTAVLSGLLTIFIALIGYRMMMGRVPGVRDGVGRALRVGTVLALMTSWPAFQTLVYRVAVDGPGELADVILPAAGLSSDAIDARIQAAYDDVSLGSTGNEALRAETSTTPSPPASQDTSNAGSAATTARSPLQVSPPMPQVATLLILSTSGAGGAMRLVVGFLIAIGPVAIPCLLFDSSAGFFEGWVRSLIGAVLGVLTVTITTAIELPLLESELRHAHAVQTGAERLSTFDPGAASTMICVFAAATVLALAAASRCGGAFRLARADRARPSDVLRHGAAREGDRPGANPHATPITAHDVQPRARATAVSDALMAASRRSLAIGSASHSDDGARRSMTIRQEQGAESRANPIRLSASGRRATSRRTRSAQRRDMTL